ncbi:MAG: hypothetical protein F6K10_23075 [Moorea sp. SIO2B7]|nr:hypothetical protein [Moorena sp. SIO2B7]
MLELLANLRTNLELRKNKSKDDLEAIMNLSPAYLQERQQWILEGSLEGKREGKIQLIENLLKIRFQGLDEDLQNIIPRMVTLSDEELSRLLLTLEREELLAKFINNDTP